MDLLPASGLLGAGAELSGNDASSLAGLVLSTDRKFSIFGRKSRHGPHIKHFHAAEPSLVIALLYERTLSIPHFP
jgi:hypothetical protein